MQYGGMTLTGNSFVCFSNLPAPSVFYAAAYLVWHIIFISFFAFSTIFFRKLYVGVLFAQVFLKIVDFVFAHGCKGVVDVA